MKAFIKTTLFIYVTILLGCNESFLNKSPLDTISTKDYWKTPKDLELYINQFYPIAFAISGSDRYEGIFAADLSTDDLVSAQVNDRLRGSRVVPAAGGWNYTTIRNLNYFFEHYTKVEGDFERYRQFVGEAHFFRAYFYFQLVAEFGDVPLITKVLETDDPELYGVRTPRNQVIDFIIEDLNKAAEFMDPAINTARTRLNKGIALLLKSRVCLYEGSWEKYHAGTQFGVAAPEPDKYFQLAAESSSELISSGLYTVYKTGNPNKDYFFFGETDYSNNPEVLLWKKYDLALNHGHSRQFQIATGKSGGAGLTKSLVESYLCTDGRPIFLSSGVSNPLYSGDGSLKEVVQNRDPRLHQTIFVPGDPLQISGADTVKFVRPVVDQPAHTKNTTGYQLKKTLNYNPVHHITSETLPVGYTGWIIFRYAEALLNFAEAKAELGTISQNDLDRSINLLRERVAMPPMKLAAIHADPNWQFPGLSAIINEIRRERRVELAWEGFRWNDIARWAAAGTQIAGKRLLGAKFNLKDYPDLKPENFRLTDGYFDEYKDVLPGGFGFRVDRDYLSPLSTEELTLNPQLKQNPGW